jgi:hypothetical protein
MSDSRTLTINVNEEFCDRLVDRVETDRRRRVEQLESKGWTRQSQALRQEVESQDVGPASAALTLLKSEIDWGDR